ncbi:uncharacterized protein LOC110230528 isoform X2 [Arabidopsis lyrata subsp. lyrata]|uniref:uncharacterized protein LOC110230528 isoform X2 n=1 Tax=Arabidopsis lyrata subsp. lyrata TaxID=81972 RepID=UPI000A29D751|nr:uncharacterized protein LOC110230528 isoform X2 [Arabidopsis lyrata subsp. lyrata]|eukprot:XP_020889488.1 uncharacterized protein LOC110230528 isoform X2 [Arabidopsis lyrata subsp. lyrata]
MNHTYICLVPKIESPTQVKDFRPISLCNIAYKLISKVMAERLKLWLHCLISEFQSAFIPGRLITDNVIITHELLHSLRTKKIKSPFMALKLDIAKAFDKVEWNYLLSILRRFGFAEKWCQWIMKCVTTVTYSVLINGSPSKKIIPSRGLRQDDSLLFCQANEQECHQILQLLQVYATASGQHVNFQKSAILFAQIRRFRWSSIKEKQKIPWIAWTKLTMMKQYRGMGFRDLSHFNTALLAKQSWRMLKEPHSLLSRVLKAKYFYKTSLMEAAVGHRPSHAWRSIMQGLMKPCTTSWDEEKLQEKICPEDAQLIRRIRLRLLKGPDVPTWIFTKDGQYTVKSGYHQLSKPHPDCSITSTQLQDNIAHRRIKISSDCLFCGDAAETIPHLFFQCRVAKEI